MGRQEIFGLVRHALTFVGGYVVAKGYADEATVTGIVGGIMTIVGGVWSIANKKTLPKP